MVLRASHTQNHHHVLQVNPEKYGAHIELSPQVRASDTFVIALVSWARHACNAPGEGHTGHGHEASHNTNTAQMQCGVQFVLECLRTRGAAYDPAVFGGAALVSAAAPRLPDTVFTKGNGCASSARCSPDPVVGFPATVPQLASPLPCRNWWASRRHNRQASRSWLHISQVRRSRSCFT